MSFLQHPKIILLFAFAYLLGAIPFGIVIVRLFSGEDIRKYGSGNIGATNAKRTGGWAAGLATLAADMAKGAIPVWIAASLFGRTGTGEIICALTALAAFFGHLFPVYLGFKTGGKGVATAAGAFAVISPAALLAAVSGFILLVAAFRRVSAGSIGGAAILPASVFFFTSSPVFFSCALVISILILWRHRENIRRLIDGNEPRL